MDFKRWFKEEKSSFGAFLFVVMVSLVFYALKPNDQVNYDLSQIKEVKATKMVVARQPIKMVTSPDSELKAELKPVQINITLAALSSEIETPKFTAKKVNTDTKQKAKPSTQMLSKEDIVKCKLKAGMTVNQIAKAPGCENKYIRKVKKRNLCYY